ncbi:MAG: GGDEF domain-containing protein [Alphaproteobacteria bacterium]|nr:MAG: GGDEF domain-containing protein [Alphaproteobacteria bacterium]
MTDTETPPSTHTQPKPQTLSVLEPYGGDPYENACEWAKEALKRLVSQHIPPSPDHFTLFYHYVCGRSPEIKQSIDHFNEHHITLTVEQCSVLYQRYFGSDPEHRAFNEANQSINTELRKLMEALERASERSELFGESLDSSFKRLGLPISADELRDMVSQLARDSRDMAQENNQLKEQLSDSLTEVNDLKQNLEKVQKETMIDPLTQVGNRKYFAHEIERTMHEAKELHTSLILLMIDIDFFKKFNDNHGHQAGDQVLRLVGRTLRDNVKGRDIVARYGGEEFAILLVETRLQDAIKVADNLRISVGSKQIIKRPSNISLGSITLSVGITEYALGEDISEFIERADRALYAAKSNGRNRSEVETTNTPMALTKP